MLKPLHIGPAIGGLSALIGMVHVDERHMSSTHKPDSIEVVDVCRATGDHVECWSPAGVPDKLCSDRVTAYLIAHPKQMLMIAFNGKTRLILVRQGGGGRYSPYIDDVMDRAHRSLDWASPGGEWRLGTHDFRPFYYYPSESEKSVDLFVSAVSAVEGDAKIELKQGATAKLGGETIGLESIVPDPSNAAPRRPENRGFGPQWELKLTYRPNKASAGPMRLTLWPYGYDGKLISIVDADGNPDKRVRLSASYEPTEVVSALANPPFIVTKVNPALVKYARLGGVTAKVLSFTGIRLDPNGEQPSRLTSGE